MNLFRPLVKTMIAPAAFTGVIGAGIVACNNKPEQKFDDFKLIQEKQDKFIKCDTDEDGKIDFREYVRAYAPMDVKKIEQYINADEDQDKTLNMEEFLTIGENEDK